MPQLNCLYLKLPTFDKFSLELLFIYLSPQIGDDVLQKLTDGNTNFHRTANDKVNQFSFLFSELYSHPTWSYDDDLVQSFLGW